MKPAPFTYIAPHNLAEALAAKAVHGDDAMFLAGGQSLVPAMNFRLAEPTALIDLNAITDIGAPRVEAGELRIGALTRHRDLQYDGTITAANPLLREAVLNVAHPQIRNRGTLCGNLAHADPASEMPAVMLALDARLRLASQSSERWVAAQKFFTGIYTTACSDDEMLVEVAVPIVEPGTGTCFLEEARRPGDYPMMGVAVCLSVDADGRCANARLAYCSAGETPILATAAAEHLIGTDLAENAVAAAAERARHEIEPMGSVHASVGFQRHLAAVLTQRAVPIARARALGEAP